MVDLDKAFTKLAPLQITKEITEEALLTIIVEMVSIVPPELFELAINKRLTLLKYLEWSKKYSIKKLKEHKAQGNMRKVKKDLKVIQLLKMVYATLGALRTSAMLYPRSKRIEFFDPKKLKERLQKLVDKSKEIDPDGYKNLKLLLNLIEKNPDWWEKQVIELRDFFAGE